MAVRSRPRGGYSKEDLTDAHEERNMWNLILDGFKKLQDAQTQAAAISNKIVEHELALGESPNPSQLSELQDLYRNAVRLAEKEISFLREEPTDLLRKLQILIALRTASEADSQNASRPFVSKVRNTKRKFEKLEGSEAADSPGNASVGSSLGGSGGRNKGAGRSTSVAAASREVSVKVEEGTEGAKGVAAERTGQLIVGAEVFYKMSKIKNFEGEGIQCIITAVHGPDGKRRYDVQDVEQENGEPGTTYRAHASSLIPIPPAGVSLPDFPKAKQVLARYPDTTTFYKAEVMGVKKDMYRLKFEGEEDDKEMDVDKRFVLDVGGK